MNRCDLHRIDQWVHGELDDVEAAGLRAHLSSCVACSREAQLMERERSLFVSRAQGAAVAPPSFAEVLASLHAAPAQQAPLPLPITSPARRPRRVGLIVSSLLPIAAAFAFALLAGRDQVSLSNSGIVLAPGPACYEGGPFSAELAALDDDGSFPAVTPDPAVAAVENRYAACLLSSPMQMGVITAAPSRECDSNVTCEPLRPIDCGTCEGQAGGGDHP